MRILQVNAIYGLGSTGVIVEDIGKAVRSAGGETLFACQKFSEVLEHGYQIGNILDWKRHSLLSMVYTGNLLIERDASPVQISRAMKSINKGGLRITLDIYSPTELPPSVMKELNENGCRHHGNIPRDQVADIQNNADIVVFVESLETKHRYAAKLSFSTNLTDYFKSGKCIFAIGDKTIAPIEYLEQNNAAVISTDYAQVEANIRKLVENPELLNIYGKSAFECGKRNHNEDLIRERFVSTFLSAASEYGKTDSFETIHSD